MKKIILLLSFMCGLYTTAQTTISVSGVTAGGLSTAITTAGGNLSTITNLTVSGTIDSRDFLAMRQNMPALTSLDLLNTNVAAYGTNPANAMPYQALAYTNLGTFIFPSSITSIQQEAFIFCSLTSLTIPNSVLSIGNSAFASCTGLTSLTIPNAVTSIGMGAFSDCAGLTTLTIPNSVTSIGMGAFWGCSGLTAIYADSPTPINLSSSANVFNNVDVTTCVLNVPACSVAAYSTANQWQDFVNIVTKTISVNGVTPGGLSAAIIAACGNLSTITNLTVSGTIDSRDFLAMRDNMPVLASVNLSNTTVAAYNSNPANAMPAQAFYNANTGVAKTSLSSFIFPSSITSIQLWGFTGCTGLTSLNIPNSVTFIDEQSFMICTGLTSVSLPTSITGIGNLTFSGCTNLASITIPSSVTSIGESAFLNCTSLTALTLPASLTLINMTAFQGCIGLTSIVIPNSVTTIGNRAFYSCSGLTSVSIPSVVTIGNEAFAYCTGLTSLTIPTTVTSIGISAFQGCSGLTSLTIMPSITNIDNSVFYGCSGLTSVTIPSSVTAIGNSAFGACSGLTSVTIPNTVTTIGNNAFNSCTGLTSVTIPSSVTTIGNSAFQNCVGLTAIYANSITPINLTSSIGVFQGVNVTTCVLNVPSGSEAAYSTANQWQDFTNINPFLGTNDFDLASKITVYPNPSNGVFHINSDTRGTTVVYDLIGKIIKTETIILGSSTLDLTNYPSGMYLMKVTTDSNQTKTMKLVKQ